MLGTHMAKLGNSTISSNPSASALARIPAAVLASRPGSVLTPWSAGQPAPGPSGSG